MLDDIPTGRRVFVDANIICYAIICLPGLEDLSYQCQRFFLRVAAGDLAASTSTVAVGEAIHKVMLAEANERWGDEQRITPHKLSRRPKLIRELTQHLPVVNEIAIWGVSIHPVPVTVTSHVARSCCELGLLHNDAVTVLLMRHLGIVDLATNDDEFRRIPGIRVWMPR